MPIRNACLKEATLAAHNQISYEQLLSAWLLSDGWEVLVPVFDHGKKTDLVISDDEKYYRIQVKTVESADASVVVENKWDGANIDYIVYFSRSAEWGYILPAFPEKRRALDAPGHVRFHQHPKNFLKMFKKV